MDAETLTSMRNEVERQFNELQDELKRLQGEYRLLTKIMTLEEQIKAEEALENATNTTE